MPTTYELLMSCPEGQELRLRLALKAIIEGRWPDAAGHLRNAARETEGQWSADAAQLAASFETKIVE